MDIEGMDGGEYSLVGRDGCNMLLKWIANLMWVDGSLQSRAAAGVTG